MMRIRGGGESIGGGAVGGALVQQQRGATVRVQGFKMTWQLQLDGEKMYHLRVAEKER